MARTMMRTKTARVTIMMSLRRWYSCSRIARSVAVSRSRRGLVIFRSTRMPLRKSI